MRSKPLLSPSRQNQLYFGPFTSLTTNGESTLSSHPADGQIHGIPVTIRGQQMSAKAGVERDIVGDPR